MAKDIRIDPAVIEELLRRYFPKQGEAPLDDSSSSTQTSPPTLYRGGDTVPPLSRNSIRVANPAYTAFMDALDKAYSLYSFQPGSLKFADIDARSEYETIETPPKILVDPGTNHPKLSVALIPRHDDRNVTGSDQYHAPLLLKDVQRWGLLNGSLGKYKINGIRGLADESKEMFPEPINLQEFIDKNINREKEIISGSTPVVEALSFLPIAPNGEFQTEFNPEIRFDFKDHSYYRVYIVCEDKLSMCNIPTAGRAVTKIDDSKEIKDIPGKVEDLNWRADFFPDLSDFEQLLKQSSNKGHMILIAVPVESPKPKYIPPTFNLGSDYKSGESLMMGGTFRGGGASVGSISISEGSVTGQSGLSTSELLHSDRGTPVIFHLTLLGIKPDQVDQLDTDKLRRLSSKVDSYLVN